MQRAKDQESSMAFFAYKAWTQIMSREERKWESTFSPAVPYSKNFPNLNKNHIVWATLISPSKPAEDSSLRREKAHKHTKLISMGYAGPHPKYTDLNLVEI